MGCDKCIFEYFYGSCNHEWNGDEYPQMLKVGQCPFSEEGRRLLDEYKTKAN